MSVSTPQQNRLSAESSPYLKQHQNNPVDWYPWGEEALSRARTENKPIFLSIGYSACHWCHVMAHESFEDETTAKILNENFINIKVDREERPDIDEIYMEAVQLMTRHGGWPLSVFLTPDLKPFFGGTYFPLEKKYGQPSFKDVLEAIKRYFNEQGDEVAARAKEIKDALSQRTAKSESNAVSVESSVELLQPFYKQLLVDLMNEGDKNSGGYSGAPKFPQPSKILAHLHSGNATYVEQALLTLEKIACGGITDQIGGGISRYSVDGVWLVPHFEKMLYDNAQLLPLYATASVMCEGTQKERSALFKDVAESIYDYLERDLKDNKTFLYYSAEDADSEGEEGRFYFFFQDEFNEVFESHPELREFAKNYFKVSERGNFEGATIFTRPTSDLQFAAQHGMPIEKFRNTLAAAKKVLFEARAERERPGRDEKCLLAWNALAASGLMKAGISLANQQMLNRGLTLTALLVAQFKKDGTYFHTRSGSELKIEAFCDDSAFLLEALVDAALLTGNSEAVNEAQLLINQISQNFLSPDRVLYYSAKSDDQFIRPYKPEDNVIYSAHAAIVGATSRLSAWLNAQGKSTIQGEQIQLLQGACLENISGLATAAPLACARILQHVSWFQRQAFVLVESETLTNPNAFTKLQKGLNALSYPVPFGQLLRKSELIGLATFAKEASERHEDVKFSYCDSSGCQLPASNVEEMLTRL